MNTTLIRQLDIPNLLSLSGLVLALLSAIFAIEGQFYPSILCLLYCGLIDTFDGFTARRLNRSEAQASLGGTLDSLVDLCSFGFAPVIFGYCYGLSDWLSVGILVFYLLACATRLAYFETAGLQQIGEKNCFVGLPVTFAALFFPTFFILDLFLERSTMMMLLSFTYLGLAFAMVAGFHMAKQSSKHQRFLKRYIALPIGAFILTVVYGIAISS